MAKLTAGILLRQLCHALHHGRDTCDRLAGRILTAKKADPNADTSALEAEIDKLVYRLYDLTPEEIAVVESSAK